MLEDEPELGVGDTVRLMPGYAPTTVNLYDCYFVIEDGLVADVWPVRGRYGAETAGVGGGVKALDGRVAVVTGAASGVGRGIAEVLARRCAGDGRRHRPRRGREPRRRASTIADGDAIAVGGQTSPTPRLVEAMAAAALERWGHRHRGRQRRRLSRGRGQRGRARSCRPGDGDQRQGRGLCDPGLPAGHARAGLRADGPDLVDHRAAGRRPRLRDLRGRRRRRCSG